MEEEVDEGDAYGRPTDAIPSLTPFPSGSLRSRTPVVARRVIADTRR